MYRAAAPLPGCPRCVSPRAASAGHGSSSSTSRLVPVVVGLTAVLAAREPGRPGESLLRLPRGRAITGGMVLLVYGMTRAAQHGWGNRRDRRAARGLRRADRHVFPDRVAHERRAVAPEIFRLRTLRARTRALIAPAPFSQFFLLTLYLQQVLHYSAIKTGLGYIALTRRRSPSPLSPRARDQIGVRRSCRPGWCSRPSRSCCSHACRCTATTSAMCSRGSWSAGSGSRSCSSRCRSAAHRGAHQRTRGSPPG